jgi:hypothetical protein
MRRLLALLLVLTAACGTTHVVANDPGARVWVDGDLVGRGQGRVNQRGLPGSATVLVKTEDGRRQQASMSRSFTITTFLLGFITYGVCWIACWEYPGSLLVEIPGGPVPSGGPAPPGGYAIGDYTTAPGSGGADPWLQPPAGWHAGAPAAAPTPGD